MSDAVLVAVIIGLAGPTVGALVHKWLTRKRDGAETVGTVADQWQDWAAELKARVAALEAKVSTLETALAVAESTNQQLRALVDLKSRLLRSVVRWAITLRDELLKTDPDRPIPPMPVDVESALTSLGD